MKVGSTDVAFSASTKEQQAKRGSRAQYERVERAGGWSSRVTPDLVQFLASVRSFYLGTASADGQPYIQHRGVPPGGLRVIDETTLGFADYGGNKQYITLGNLAENPKAFIFIMDYANRRRLKFWGRARYIEDDAALLQRLSETTLGAPQRAIVFDIAAWDRNCPQHIPQRFEAADVAKALASRDQRIAELEEQIAKLRADV
ncbi:MAG: pyridoxamine 5'-phosphate oxidase family protein [Hyphomicrobium sp.]|nr:pyridoxamine 5'-phosphate oxidase family protein [Hyphomicrobium sp.]